MPVSTERDGLAAAKVEGRSGRRGDPPKDPGDDVPAGALVQNDCLILAVFGFEHVKFRVTAQTRDAQSLFFAGDNDNLAAELHAVGLGRIYGGDVAVVDEGLHGVPAHAEQTGIGWIWAPLQRRSHHFASWEVIEVTPAVSHGAVSAGGGPENRDWHNPGPRRCFLLAAASRRGEFQLGIDLSRKVLAVALGKHTHHVTALQSGALPIEP